MDAGRELDALIAEKVMGYRLDYEFADLHGAPCVKELRDQYDEWGILPDYSTDIAAAWQVVDHLRPAFRLRIFQYSCYEVQFESDTIFLGRADTVPHAICIAALKAIQPPNQLISIPS